MPDNPHLFALPDPGDAPAADPGPAAVPATITVIGVADDRLELLAPEALDALTAADLVVGGRRHLALWQSWRRSPVGRHGLGPVGGRHVAEHAAGAGAAGLPAVDSIEVGGDIDHLVGLVRQRAIERGERVCVLASGDPGFFGIVRSLLRTIDRRSLRVLPAPSSISLAFSRLGLPWDDAVVVSSHGRLLAEAVSLVRTVPKAAVLTSPESPPEAVARALLDAGVTMDLVAVCSRLGAPDEEVAELTLEELAAGRYDPLSVVVLVGPGGLPLVGWQSSGLPEAGTVTPGPGRTGLPASPGRRLLAWGLPDGAYVQRGGLATKGEVRSVVLGKLALPSSGVLWVVGDGSGDGSVAVECALLQPGLTVLALEASTEAAARISAAAEATGAGVHVVGGEGPGGLGGLPAPDRAFVASGDLAVL
ncbi:MAG: precorrin-6y C5,15-methyltransferase (decarboxylating) subunit CbiE, partial [Acidimicrobiales bacterium]